MIYLIQGRHIHLDYTGYLNIEPYVGFVNREAATLFDDSVDPFEVMIEEHLAGKGIEDYTIEKIKLYDIDELVNL